MAAPFIPRTKALLQKLSIEEAEKATFKALEMSDSRMIRESLREVLQGLGLGT